MPSRRSVAKTLYDLERIYAFGRRDLGWTRYESGWRLLRLLRRLMSR